MTNMTSLSNSSEIADQVFKKVMTNDKLQMTKITNAK